MVLIKDGFDRNVAFASRKLSPTQNKPSAIEKERYAVLFAVQWLEHYVTGAKILLCDDKNPLKFSSACASNNSKLTFEHFSYNFDIEVRHRSGTLTRTVKPFQDCSEI